MEEKKIDDFVREIYKSISKYNLTILPRYYENDIFEYIVELVSKHYRIDKLFILRSKKRGEVTEARKMCLCLMKEHLGLSDSKIGDFLGGRSRQSINIEFKQSALNQEKLTTKNEVKFVEDFLVLTKNVDVFKKTYNIEKRLNNE